MLTATPLAPVPVPAQPMIPTRRRAAQPPTLSLPEALGELGHLATLSPMLAVREGSRVLAHLLNNPEFLAGQGSALLTTPAAPGPYVAWQVLGPQNAYALQVFV